MDTYRELADDFLERSERSSVRVSEEAMATAPDPNLLSASRTSRATENTKNKLQKPIVTRSVEHEVSQTSTSCVGASRLKTFPRCRWFFSKNVACSCQKYPFAHHHDLYNFLGLKEERESNCLRWGDCASCFAFVWYERRARVRKLCSGRMARLHLPRYPLATRRIHDMT